MPDRIPEDFIIDLRHRADIVEVIRDYVPLKKQGQNYVGLCPFHAEKTPSFVVSPHKQIYHCFGCGKGGNVFSFIMEKNALSYPEAVAVVAKRYGLTVPQTVLSAGQDKQNSLRKRYHHINELAAQFYQKILYGPQGKQAVAYLNKRGLSEETRQRFLLGYAPADWDQLSRFLLVQGVKEEEIINLGLAVRSQRGTLVDRFRNRVMFPICDDRGRVIGFGGRVMDDSLPKYLNSPETALFSKGKNLYGLNLARGEIRNKEQVIIMEGYMDVITAHQQGIINAVGALGTSLTAEQARLLMRYTYNMMICFDSDSAGQEAALRGMDVLQQLGCRVAVVTVPGSKDPDEYLKTAGVTEFLELVKKAPSLFEYKLQYLMDKYETDTVQGRIQIAQKLVQDLKQVQSPVARQAFIQLLSEKLGLPESTIYSELRKAGRNLSSTPGEGSRPAQLSANITAIEKAEKNVLRIVLENPRLVSEIEQHGGAELFSNQIIKEIYQAYYLLRQAGHNIKANDLISLLDDQQIRQFLPELLLEEEYQAEEAERVFQDSLTNLLLEGLNRRINEKSELMRKLEKDGDISCSVEIMAQIQQMIREKQRLTATLRKGGN